MVMAGGSSYTARLKAHLVANPNKWIPAIQLAEIGGQLAWRTRLSDLRRKHGLDIQNRLRRTVTDDGAVAVVSEFLFTPGRSRVSPPLHRVVTKCGECGGAGWQPAGADGRSVIRCRCRMEAIVLVDPAAGLSRLLPLVRPDRPPLLICMCPTTFCHRTEVANYLVDHAGWKVEHLVPAHRS
jgi:hypothetical protein